MYIFSERGSGHTVQRNVSECGPKKQNGVIIFITRGLVCWWKEDRQWLLKTLSEEWREFQEHRQLTHYSK